ncbi:MAG: riboflavin synthase [Proteobacteria bacterium]|nr:riboflavin synthase [Pseudomonadota bacterium]
MFTGLIEAQGEVIENKMVDIANQLIIKTNFDELLIGESIAVDGVCLTYKPLDKNHLLFDVSPETLKMTTLSALKPGDKVNLERAMQVNTRFGGHYVSGHVDAMATLLSIKPLAEYIEMKVGGFDKDAILYLIPKGSITINGVSLTINALNNDTIELMLVPHTLEVTTLGQLKVNQQLNIEFDYLTRIVAHQLQVTGQLIRG